MPTRLTAFACLAVFTIEAFAADNQPKQPDMQATTRQAWQFEYDEISDQIAALKNWRGIPRERLEAEALDRQALVRKTDGDPLDVVRRRTSALLSLHRNNATMDDGQLDRFQARLKQLADQATNTDKPGLRKALFYSCPGSAWVRTAFEALPRATVRSGFPCRRTPWEAEPPRQCVPRREPWHEVKTYYRTLPH